MNFNHDITFCINKECSNKFNCARNVINNKFEKGELISQCDFKSEEIQCIYFIKRGG